MQDKNPFEERIHVEVIRPATSVVVLPVWQKYVELFKQDAKLDYMTMPLAAPATAFAKVEHLPIIAYKTLGDRGQEEVEYFALSPELEKIFAAKDNEIRELKTEVAYLTRLQTKEAERTVALAGVIRRFNQLPWYKRILLALRGGL